MKKTKHELKREIKALRKSIKKDCYDCMGGMKKTDCEMPECSLYPFRPFKKQK